MHIEYQLTWDDWSDGHRIVAAHNQRRQKKRTRRWGWSILLPLLVVDYGITWIASGKNEERCVAATLLPVVWLQGMWGMSSLFNALLARRRKLVLKAIGKCAAGLIVSIFCTVALAYNIRLIESIPLKSALQQLLAPLLGWVFIMTVIFALGGLSLRKKLRRIWDDSLELQRPRQAEISEHGIVIWDVLTRWEYLWNAFEHQEETSDLFVLFTSPWNCIFIPKRAFAGQADLDQMRECVKKPASRGFEVIPK